MYQTLEHVSDPAYVVERSYQLLKPGGLLVIEVPNLQSFDMKIDKERKRLSYDLPRHLNHFTPAVLNKKLASLGLKVIHTDLYYPNFVLNLTSRARKASAKSTGAKTGATPVPQAAAAQPQYALAKPRVTRKVRLLKTISRFLPGWRFSVVARKPG
jgi:hypothetical protein